MARIGLNQRRLALTCVKLISAIRRFYQIPGINLRQIRQSICYFAGVKPRDARMGQDRWMEGSIGRNHTRDACHHQSRPVCCCTLR